MFAREIIEFDSVTMSSAVAYSPLTPNLLLNLIEQDHQLQLPADTQLQRKMQRHTVVAEIRTKAVAGGGYSTSTRYTYSRANLDR